MSHQCEAAIITCEDFRLHQRKDGRNYIAEFIENLGIDCDLITRGGSVQDIVRPEMENFDKSVLRDSEVADRLHNVNTVYLVNHEDCGAYGGMKFKNREEEIAQHIKDMRQAGEIILKYFPRLEIKIYFAYLQEGTDDVFEIEKVD